VRTVARQRKGKGQSDHDRRYRAKPSVLEKSRDYARKYARHRYHTDSEFRVKHREYMRHRYQIDAEVRARAKAASAASREAKKTRRQMEAANG